MAEAVKVVIYNRGEQEVGGKLLHAYLCGIVLLTDKPIEGFIKPGCYSMGISLGNPISETLSSLPKAAPKWGLGTIDLDILHIANMSPEDFNDLLDENENV